MGNLIGRIQSTLRLPYYNVPTCPRCASRITGRFVKGSRNVNDNDWIYIQSLKNGEIVETALEIPEDNAFCMTCGFCWPENVVLSYVPVELIKNEKKERGTLQILEDEYKKMHEEEKAKDAKHGKLVNTARKFIGKL